MRSPESTIYTLRDCTTEGFTQGPMNGGTVIGQTQDGNFFAAHVQGHILGRQELSQKRFAEIFGRVPVRGLSLRADVFVRLCRLGGLNVFLFDTTNEEDGPIPEESDVLLRTEDPNADPKAPSYALVLQPDGNIQLVSSTVAALQGGQGIDYDRFESMFGFEPRENYFCNEVLRIAGLGGLRLAAYAAPEEGDAPR